MPSADLRRPNGSRLPDGFLPIEKMPASESSLSATARICPSTDAGSAVSREARVVVITDGVGNGLRLAVCRGVVATHRALQLRELADHAGEQVAFAKRRCTLNDVSVNIERCSD